MIRSFIDDEVHKFFLFGKTTHRKGWSQVRKIVKRKLDMLDYAEEIIDLRTPPSNFLEKLKDDLAGFYSIRVNDQWRIIFKWDTQPYDVDVIDYH